MPKNTIVISSVTDNLSKITYPEAGYAVAAAFSKTAPSNYTPISSTFTYNYSSYSSKATASESVYENSLFVQNAINMFIDLIFHSLTIQHEDIEIQNIYKKVFEESNIEDAIEGNLLDYYKYGNAFPYRYRDNKIIDPFDENFDNWAPFMWNNLSPVDITVDGSTVLDKEYKFSSSSTGGSDSVFVESDTVLDQEAIYHIFAKKTVRDKKADPPFVGLAPLVDLYNALLTSNLNNCSSYTESFIHAQVMGTGPGGPKKSTIDKITNTLKGMKEGAIFVTSDQVVLNPINLNAPLIDGDVYDAIAKQMELGIGIAREMITSSVSGGGSLQWFNITKLVKMLESVRRKLQKWIDREVKYITLDLQKEGLLPDNIKVKPVIKLEEISLRDEVKIRDILIKMYEKGMISLETGLEEADFDIMVELNRKAFQKQGVFEYDGTEIPVEELLYPPPQPFQGLNSVNNQTINDGGNDGVKGGKPVGKTVTQETTNTGV